MKRWRTVLIAGAVALTAAPGAAPAGAASDTSRVAVRDLQVDVDPGMGGRFGGRVDVEVRFQVENRGTAPVQPTARIQVESQIGGGTRSAPIELPPIAPGERVEVARTIRSVLPFGNVRVVARVRADGHTATATGSSVVIPWFLLLAVVAVVAIVLVVRRRLRAGQRSS